MDSDHDCQSRGMQDILLHLARRDQGYLSLWLQSALTGG